MIPLLSIPENSKLVLEVSYKFNRMVILSDRGYSSEGRLLHYPPPAIRSLVRCLEINLDLDTPFYLNFLRIVADAQMRFSLHYLTVNINPESLYYDAEDSRESGSSVEAYLQNLGRIGFPTRHLTIVSIICGDGDNEFDPVESCWCERFGLEANGARGERWQRFNIVDGEDVEERSEYVTERSEFVTGIFQAVNDEIQHRVTIKTVSTRPKDSPYGHHRWADRPVRN